MRHAAHLGIALLFVACGRWNFDIGGSSDGASRRPWDGDFTMEPPAPVIGINTPMYDGECYVYNELTLYYATNNGAATNHDIYMATRATSDGAFGNRMLLSQLSTTGFEGRLATIDNLTGYFWTHPSGTSQGDLWTVSRVDASVPFDRALASALPISTTSPEFDPWPSTDQLRLYFGRVGVDQDIWMASRASVFDAFGSAVVVDGIRSGFEDDNATLSADERFIVFSSTRPAAGSKDLYYARRADRTQPFDTPQPLPVVNSANDDSEACLTESGELFFASDRPGGSGDFDIYRTRFIPL